jgi:hypothetical protein
LVLNAYILGAIDSSFVPIITPKVDPKSYYYRKGFYSTLIQRVLDVDCSFWGYDYGWASNIHDWALFQKNKFRQSSDERQVFTLQVDKICCLSNVTMILLSIQR